MAVGARRVLFAGDSAYHPEFGAIARRFGPFDAALIPIGAYEPRWFMRSVHMNAEEGVRAFVELRSEAPDGHRMVMVPIHWGTFKLTDEAMDEPPTRAAAAWRRAGLEPADLWLLSHGETRVMGGGERRPEAGRPLRGTGGGRY
jgi:L-ascorbate metabolism protein UlaG (beta-lactamase superfamily)